MAVDRKEQIRVDRANQAVSVFRTRHGEIDGVEFDFRHKELDSSNWRPPIFDETPVKPTDAPLLWFPWFGPFNKDTLRSEAEKEVARSKPRTLSPIEAFHLSRGRLSAKLRTAIYINDHEAIETYIADHSPDCQIFRGDKISIDHVESRIIGHTLDHLHDREVREAYLRVQRADGTVEKISSPIVYAGLTAIMDYDIGNNFNRITRRILTYFNLPDLHKMGSIESDDSHAYLALRKAFAVASANRGLEGLNYEDAPTVVKVRMPDEEFHDGSDIWYTINDAMMMGYLWAKHEVEPEVKAHAAWKRAQELKKEADARNRGRASQKAASDLNELVQRVVDKISADLWAVDPTLPKATIVGSLENKSRWAKTVSELGLPEDLRHPKADTLEKYVSEFSKGRFPVKKSRPLEG